MIFQLWEDDHSSTFVPKDPKKGGTCGDGSRAFDEESAVLVWEYDAKSANDAMQAYNDFYDFGEYKPPEDWDDVPYEYPDIEMKIEKDRWNISFIRKVK